MVTRDINIFTIVKDKNTISPLRQWCIDSWHKCMPEANIMIFDDKDLTNPNWEYYDIIKDDKLLNISTNNDVLRRKNIELIYLNQFTGNLCKTSALNSLLCNLSTDSVRLRLLNHIKNALYLDSDTYMTESVLKYCNEYPEFINDPYGYVPKFGGVNTCFGLFSKDKSQFITKLIEFYESVSGLYFYDDAAMISFLNDIRIRKYLGSLSVSDNEYVAKSLGVSFINATNSEGFESLIHLHLSSTERYGLHMDAPSKKLVKIYYTFDEVLKMSNLEKQRLNDILMLKYNELLPKGQDMVYLMSADGDNVFQIFDSHFNIGKIRIYCYTQLFNVEFLQRLKPEIIKQTKHYLKEHSDFESLRLDISSVDNVEFEMLC